MIRFCTSVIAVSLCLTADGFRSCYVASTATSASMQSSRKNGLTMSDKNDISVDLRGPIKNIPRNIWNGLLKPNDSPFLDWDWIHGLEESGCVNESTGWKPLHLLVSYISVDKEEIVGAVPLYLKGHSMGEFIFDQQWAEAAYRAGINYYPKLLVAIPFTPAGGTRILLKPGLDPNFENRIRKSIGLFLQQVAQSSGISSIHINFCTEVEVEAFKGTGFLHRKSLQYHWQNKRKSDTHGNKYKNFDEYLGAFNSKRRIKIKRERSSVTNPEEGGVTISVVKGNDISEPLLHSMFDIYRTTIDKNPYGRLYLNQDFFKRLGGDFRKYVCLIIAEKEGRVIGGTFNIVKSGKFYGRYWGTHEFVKNLHFEACYYKSIEFCIDEGLEVMEPGAGGGDFKFLRGFDPAIVHSVHFCLNSSLNGAIKHFLQAESMHIDEAAEYLNKKSAVGPI